MGDTYSNLNIGRYNRLAMRSIEAVVNSMLVTAIAESLESADVSDSYGEACATMREKRFDVLGVSENSRVIGYVPLTDGNWAPDVQCGIIAHELVDDFRASEVEPSSRLCDALQELARRQRLFVSDEETGNVVSIVTRADLQKAPVRMMAFAYMTVFEIHLTEKIREAYPNDAWKHATALRVQASALEAEDHDRRLVLGEELNLLDSLSLSKKARIARLTQRVRHALATPRVDIDALLRTVAPLRNAVAHGSSLANRNRRWAEVAALVRDVGAVNLSLEGTNGDMAGRLNEEGT